MQILLTRIFYGLALFFYFISNFLFLYQINRNIPLQYWSSNFDLVFRIFGGSQRLIEIFVQSGLLILALVLAKKKLLAFLVIGVNAFIALFHLIQSNPWSGLQGFPLGFQFRWYLKTMIGRMGLDVSWSSAEIMRLLSAILTIVAVVVAFSITNNNLLKQNLVSVNTTPPQTRVTPKAALGITGDAVEQVEKLGNLLAKGLLTQEEFDSKKKQILGL